MNYRSVNVLSEKVDSNKVMSIKLITGEEIIARIAEETETTYKLTKPLCMIATPQGGFGLAPAVFSIPPTDSVMLNKSAVAIYGASQIAYQFILKGTSLNKVLTNAKLFGSSAKAVEDTLAKVSTVEAAVKQTKKTAAKTTTKKTTANSKRVTK